MIQAIKGGCNARHPIAFQMSRPVGLANYVLLVTRSEGEFCIGGDNFSARPGSAVLLAPNTPYSYGNPKGEYVDDWLHFSVEDTALDRSLREISNRVVSLEDSHIFSWCIDQIIWEATYSPPEMAKENVEALFRLLLNHLFYSCRAREKRGAPRPYQSELRAMRLEVLSTYQEPLSAKEYAARLHMSDSYFQHLYTEYFGVSFHKDVIAGRIERAKELLLTTSLPLTQVAELCGYGSEVHFYRQFKRLVGATPAKYRRGADSEQT